ncbi:MAG: hypothetical protein N3D11_10300 [Candidatus Sumerlaeia bacterium]|nr:hypothetical protein [Candidatus Sumerlaeia bacterium]
MKYKKRSQGYVFLAVLGVMAVALLLTFAVSGATQFSYQRTAAAWVNMQEQVMARSAADYALLLLAQKKMAADGKPQPFRFVCDRQTSLTLGGTVAVTPAAANQPAYKFASLAYRPGDAILHVVSDEMLKRWGRGERYWLCNLQGARSRLIDVTAAYKGGM